MGRPKGSKNATTKKNKKVEKEVVEKVYLTCTRCGEKKVASSINFYKSNSQLYLGTYENRMTICKDCLLKLANIYARQFDSELRGIYEVCRLTDTYYSKDIFNMAKEQASKNDNADENSFYKIYFQKVASLPQYKGLTFIDSDEYLISEEIEEREKKVGRDVVEFWGEGLTQRDYDFLEREFNNLTTRYECDSYVQEMLFKQIAFQSLDIMNKRLKGIDTNRELKTLQDLLGSANVKPAQDDAGIASEQVTFGTLIKKYENEKPIPEESDENKKKNLIRYVSNWFLGNLNSMMDKPITVNKEEYEEEIKKYTVEIDGDE